MTRSPTILRFRERDQITEGLVTSKTNQKSQVTQVVPTDRALLCTPNEAARQLAIGRTKLYELIASGDLRSVRIGRAVRVPASELKSFVARAVAMSESQPSSRVNR